MKRLFNYSSVFVIDTVRVVYARLHWMANQAPTLGTILVDQCRVLTFGRPAGAIGEHWRRYVAVGSFFTWLAGVGRYWDNPRATWWQHAGLGSVAYVFLLALIVWLMLLPLRPRRWSYASVLTFITLTSLPALLYAIPVEQFMSLQRAQVVNAWFLAIVATWRVLLMVVFLRRVAALSGAAIVVGSLLPIVLIVVTLTALNLEHVVFSIMAGVRPEDVSGNDRAYGVVTMLALLSVLAAPFLGAAYLWLVYRARRVV